MGINFNLNELINFLYNNYGGVTEQGVEANRMEMIRKWLSYDPIQTIWQQINEAMDYIKAVKQVVPEPERVRKDVTLIANTAMMSDAIKDWRRIPKTTQELRTDRGVIIVVTVNNPARSREAFKRMITKEYCEAKRHHTPKNQTYLNASVNMVLGDKKVKEDNQGTVDAVNMIAQVLSTM